FVILGDRICSTKSVVDFLAPGTSGSDFQQDPILRVLLLCVLSELYSGIDAPCLDQRGHSVDEGFVTISIVNRLDGFDRAENLLQVPSLHRLSYRDVSQ